MSVKATFNNIEYDLVYNEQSGFYEIEIEAPKTGGIYNAEITFKENVSNPFNIYLNNTPSYISCRVSIYQVHS